MSAAEDIAIHLEAEGVGSRSGAADWRIFENFEPDGDDVPDRIITIYDNPGIEPEMTWAIEYPSVQVRVRGARFGASAAVGKLAEVFRIFTGAPKFQIGDNVYKQVNPRESGPVPIEPDESNRPIFVNNYELVREPVRPGHRKVVR